MVNKVNLILTWADNLLVGKSYNWLIKLKLDYEFINSIGLEYLKVTIDINIECI